MGGWRPSLRHQRALVHGERDGESRLAVEEECEGCAAVVPVGVFVGQPKSSVKKEEKGDVWKEERTSACAGAPKSPRRIRQALGLAEKEEEAVGWDGGPGDLMDQP